MVGLQFDVAGGLFVAEVLFPIFALMQLPLRKYTPADRCFLITIIAGLVYFGSLLLSDLWNGTTYEQYSRGWARIVIFLLNFASIYLLANNHRSRLLLIAAGLSVGRIWLSLGAIDGDVIAWKLGLAKPITLIMIILCVIMPFLSGPRNLLAPLLIVFAGFGNIVADFRSLGGVLIIVGALMSFSALKGFFSAKAQRRQGQSAFVLVIIIVCSAATALQFYSIAANSGWLSDRAQGKFEAQVQQSDLPLLIAGRNELLVSLSAILDAPILGHGSWPKNRYYADQLASQRYQYGLSNNPAASPDDDLIPMHSHLFGGWVEAGLAGGLFWAFILFLSKQALSKSFHSNSHMKPLYIYSAVLLVWDILFSPFAGFRRIETAFLLVIVLRALLQRSAFRTKRSRSKALVSSRRRQRRKKRIAKKGRAIAEVGG